MKSLKLAMRPAFFQMWRSQTVQLAKYGLFASIAAFLATAALAPLGSALIQDWSRRDVELRSTLVFNAVGMHLTGLLAANQRVQIDQLFERVASDARVVGVALCRGDGLPEYASKLMPSTLTCKGIARSEAESFSTLTVAGRRMLVGAFPISAREIAAHFIILHDLSYAEARGTEIRNYASALLVGIMFLSASLAVGLASYLARQWLKSFRAAVANAADTSIMATPGQIPGPFDSEIRKLLKKLDVSRNATDGEHVQWSKQALRNILNTDLPGVDVLVVANREPYIHNNGPSGIELQIPASGLVSALEPVMRACGGTWIAHGSGSADRQTVDANDRIDVPPVNPEYVLRRLWISEDEQDGYYYGLANEGLWPLCHIAFTRPIFREADWQTYKQVNERFADAVLDEAKSPSPIVLIQDYHFALLPQMIRARLPEATIITFWHIPWPNAETFGIFPWKEEVIQGLLGSSILGFHTQFHCNNFIESVDRFVESRIDREHATVCHRGNETSVRPYPISIEWPPEALASQDSVAACRKQVRNRLAVSDDTKLIVGIERFDYTKGVLDRMRAVDQLLIAHPEWKGRFVLLQAAAPSRSKLPAYSGLQEEAIRLADEINARYSDCGTAPIKLVIRHHEPAEVFELFRAADACVVSSLHDGMNLVAKEFVAARDDERGVLLLSSFAGASRELSEAIIINPYDAFAMGEALHQALTMPAPEQRERMRLMRARVSSRNVYRWAGQMLLDAARLRQKHRILRMASEPSQ
ncbi:MAG: trehalose-6-phosphate synthase [Hyphomicrobium sp.]